ncbi:MAG: 6,7-dimethyl-8-ribityllumazine synthase [Planctomycetota bacterium]
MNLDEVLTFDGTEGSLASKRIAICVSTYNRPITGKLLDGALSELSESGVDPSNVTVLWVPGAWELVVAAKKVVGGCDAVVCLGAVIKGETSHDQFINATVSRELGRISVETGKPVAFGLLTCDTVQQAMDRCGGKVGNKGNESVAAAVQMLRLFDQLSA